MLETVWFQVSDLSENTTVSCFARCKPCQIFSICLNFVIYRLLVEKIVHTKPFQISSLCLPAFVIQNI